MPSLVTTRSLCILKIERRLHSSPIEAYTLIRSCLSIWRMQEWRINGWWTKCSKARLEGTWGLCWQHVGEEHIITTPYTWPPWGIQDIKAIWDEVESCQMRLWSILWEVLEIHGLEQRNRGQSWEDPSHLGYAVSRDHEVAPAAHWKVSGIESIHLSIHWQMPPIFQNFEKGFWVVRWMRGSIRRLKKYLASSPLLSRTITGEVLYLYLAVSSTVISAALIWEDERECRSWSILSAKPCME